MFRGKQKKGGGQQPKVTIPGVNILSHGILCPDKDFTSGNFVWFKVYFF